MKYSKIISITLTNAFILVVFASLLASCQKNKIKISGHYTDLGTTSRSPASIRPEMDFDPKQIYIFCSIHSINVKQCYKQYYKEQLHLLKNENQQTDISAFMNFNEFEKVENDVNIITLNILEKLNERLDFYATKREDFCLKNSKFNMKKCLSGNIDSDTMNILNSYQQAVNKINGHEYLYLKIKIKNQLMQKLDAVNSQMEKST